MRYTEEEIIDTLERKVEEIQKQIRYIEDYVQYMYLTDEEYKLKEKALEIMKKKVKRIRKAKTLKKVNKTIDLELMMENKLDSERKVR